MKKTISLILLFAVCFGVVSCSGVNDATLTEYGFTDDKTGIEYIMCSRAVFANTLGEVYAKDGSGNEYCSVRLEEPSRFLCDNDKNVPYVYREASLPDITIENFEPIAAQIWLEGDNSSTRIGILEPETDYLRGKGYSQWTDEKCDELENNRAAEKALCEANGEKYYASYDYVYLIRDTVLNDEAKLTTPPSVDETDRNFTLFIRLLSEKYKGLYYEIVFWRDLNGVNFLFDRGTGNSYLSPYDLTFFFWEERTE